MVFAAAQRMQWRVLLISSSEMRCHPLRQNIIDQLQFSPFRMLSTRAPLLRRVLRPRLAISTRCNSMNNVYCGHQTGSQWKRFMSAAAPVDHRPVHFPGAMQSFFTNDLNFISGLDRGIPTYQVMDQHGDVTVAEQDPQLSQDELTRLYNIMLTMNAMDVVLYEAQRQGRISFYMTSYGEETVAVSAAPLKLKDVIFGQYREVGALLTRGFTLDEIMSQNFSNEHDRGKGRNMPVHYGSKDLNFHHISSTLATQIPHATGAAYALKREGDQDRIVLCYFGDGAASEGDFHASLNIAATLKAPVVFYWSVFLLKKAIFTFNLVGTMDLQSQLQLQNNIKGMALRLVGSDMASLQFESTETMHLQYIMQFQRLGRWLRQNNDRF